MSQNWFDILKHTADSNTLKDILDTPIVNYGRIIQIIDTRTVVVEGIVWSSLSKNIYTVTLLSLSSDLLEVSVEPKLGDKVLLLFLQQYDAKMFIQDSVSNLNASGYNRFSGVGILMSTVKRAAKTLLRFYEAQGEVILSIESGVKTFGTFTTETSLRFERLNIGNEDEAAISILFGQGRPFTVRNLSKSEKEHGFWKNSENELVELDAAVTERYSVYAPVTKDIQGAQTIDVGLSADKDDKPVETEAPIVETIHGKAPITRNIRSSQTIKIGIGNAESESEDEQRDAPVTIELGEKADITLSSKSGKTEEYKKTVSLKSGDAVVIEATQDAGISGSTVTVEAQTTVEIKNAATSLGAIIGDFITIVSSWTANSTAPGSPVVVDPTFVPRLQELKGRVDSFLK